MLLKVFDPKVDMSELRREGDRTVGRFEWLGDARKAGSAASGGDRTLCVASKWYHAPLPLGPAQEAGH